MARNGHSQYKTEFRVARLRTFEATDLSAPLEALIEYAARHPAILRDVNPTKLERLVGATIGRALECEVEHCGRTGDGGIDLFVMDGETKLLVQVKRREKPSTESVQTVRELLAATLLHGSARASIVTTAAKFSSAARLAAATAIKLRLVEQFDLVDFDRFASILNLISRGEPPWRKYAVNELGSKLPIFRMYVG